MAPIDIVLSVPLPHDEILACRNAHLRLTATLDGLTAEDGRRPSRLPGWTVAHVVSHLARNADSVLRRLQGVMTGELVPQYAGGARGREAEIEHDVAQPFHIVTQNALAASEAVDLAFSECPTAVWDSLILMGTGETRPASQLAMSRWREVEIHHVDLGFEYTADDWDDAFVDRFLPGVLGTLEQRGDRRTLLAWGLGRADAPGLEAWG